MVVIGDSDGRGDKHAALNAIGAFALFVSAWVRGRAELGVAEDAAGGPFGEFDFGFDFGAEESGNS
jgi:hypothetical protein